MQFLLGRLPKTIPSSCFGNVYRRTSIINEPLSQDDYVRLLAENSSRLMSFIRIITMNNQHDAEEIFQRTCIVLWEKFAKFDGDNFGAWACRIAQFEMLKHRDSKRRIKTLNSETIEHLATVALPISEALGERRAALTSCLKKLPDADHDLIRHRYYDGLSVNEISELVGRSTHAIYRELSRVHAILSRCVERTLVEAEY